MKSLKDKVVAVTGAGSGIGRALAKALVTRGAHVALSDISQENLAETKHQLAGSPTRVTTHVVDVRDRQAVESYAQQVEQQHGGVDAIINNAGISARQTLEKMSYDDLALVIDVNLWGVIHGIKAFMPLMRKRPEGHIVNISSINAFVPFAKNGPYNAAKSGVLGLSETLMQELAGEAIRVSVVHPGGIKTNIAVNSPGVSSEEAAFFSRIARTSPRSAAEQILRGVERDRQRIYVGADAEVMQRAKRWIPAATVALVGRASYDMPGRRGTR